MKRLSSEPSVHPGAKIIDCSLGAWTEVYDRAVLIETVLGDYSYVTNDCRVTYSEIGKFCNIAPYSALNPNNHPMWRATLHHFTYRSFQYDMAEDDSDFFQWRRRHKVILGHDAWIGHGAMVLPGKRVGTGAVVGAGAVVTKDVPPFTIVAGVPAEPIRDRFPDRLKQDLMDMAWWDWPHKSLKLALKDFRSLHAEDFVAKYRGAGSEKETA